ncbi:MAG: EFR1 family ferrodoxin [Promethearchaeota archaeon]
MKIALFYFSATNNTKIISEVIEKTLEDQGIILEVFDITDLELRQKTINFTLFDRIIFGFPVYAWRAPGIIRDWIKKLEGHARKCAVFFTYGGVNIGAAHYDMYNLLKKQNFIPVLFAEFLGKHTYNLGGWNLMEHRPNPQDLAIAEQFALKALKKFQSEEQEEIIIVKFEKKEQALDRMQDMAKNAVPIPSREEPECCMCRTCERLCPTGAMNAEKGEPDSLLCIRCLRCVINCPDEILTIKDMSKHLHVIKKINHLTDDILEARISKIIE